MKKINFWRSATAVMMAAALALSAACSDDPEIVENPDDQEQQDPDDPNEPDDPTEEGLAINTAAVGETTSQLKSVLVTDFYGYLYTVATPTEGLTTMEEIADEDNVMIMVDPELVGTEFDLLTEEKTFSVAFSWGDAYVSAGTDYAEEITEGSCLVTKKENDLYEFYVQLTAADGTAYAARVEGTFTETAEAPGAWEIDLAPNTFYVDGLTTEVGSAAIEEFSGTVYIAATPTEGLSSTEDIFGEDHYMYVLVNPSLIGQEIDLATSHASECSIMVVWDGQVYEIGEDKEEILGGKLLVTQDGDNYEFTYSCAFADGSVLGMRASASYAEELNTNTITIDGRTDVVRKSFYTYMADYGMHMVYFTSSDVDYFDEMTDLALKYAYVMVPDALVDGQVIDLEAAASEGVMVGMNDNVSGAAYMATEGTLKIKQTGEGAYEVSLAGCKLTDMDGSAPDATLEIEFAGQALSVDYVPSKANAGEYNGAPFTITGASITKDSANVWTIRIQTDHSNGAVAITMPAECFKPDYAAYGFSFYPEMKIAFGSQVWNYATSTGTVSLALNGTEIEVEFTTYGDLSGYYKGEVTIQ